MLCMIAAVAVNAQGIGLKAGINLANVSSEGESADMKMGFHFGVVSELALSDALYFAPGLIYSQKGYQYKLDLGIISFDEKYTYTYLEVPLDFIYKMDLGGDSKFTIAAGPYLAYGLNVSYKDEDGNESESFKDMGMKSLDFGLNLGVGVEFSALKISAQYGLGLANTSDMDDYKETNNVIGISVGYFFGR